MDVGVPWGRAYTPQIFTQRKFDSSLTRSWLMSLVKGEGICPLSEVG
jgi:hypothetical protein